MKAVVFMALLLLMSGIGFAQTNMTACQDIVAAGYYVLENDVIVPVGTNCFNVGVPFVTIDCQGHIIDGEFVDTTGGVYGWTSWLTIKNCIFEDMFGGAVGTDDPTGYQFINNTLRGNMIAGVGGYNLASAPYLVANNTFNVSCPALSTWGQNGTITGNRFYDRGGSYITFNDPDVLVYNNYFPNNRFTFGDPNFYEDFNISKRTGDRIEGNGKLGGNYFADYASTCQDDNEDGFCDVPLTINTNAIDYLPLSDLYVDQLPVPVTELVEVGKHSTCIGNAKVTTKTFSYCGNTSCATTSANSTENCLYGCTQGNCDPSPFEVNILVLAFFIIIIVIAAAYAKSR